jgi:Ig-like domain from next to BRCA1 gene
MKATRNGFPSTSTRVGLLGMVVGLILAGCNQPVSGSAGTQAWIDAPLHESTHPVAPMEIVLHGADPGGVAMIELSINGEVLSRRPPEDTSAALSMMKVQWDPAAAGEYVLVARAQDHSGAWSPQASSVVTLLGPLVNLQMVTPTSTPTTSVTPTPTPTPACVDRAAFVADVRIPDNTVIAPGGTFVKVWRLRNDGTCPWDESYSVVFVDGHPMSNPTPMPIPEVVQPGATVDISLPLVAPTSPGTYRGDYQIRNPQGVHFGVGSGGQTPFYVQIVVAPPQSPTRTPTQPPPPDTQPPSVSVSHSPPGSTAAVGSVITFTANASDNVGVTRIDIWVTAPGGWPTKAKTCTNTTTCSYTGGPYNTVGNLSYFAVAADAAGHEANSSAGSIVIQYVIT